MSCTHWTRGLRLYVLVACFVMFLSGCSKGDSDKPVLSSAPVTIAGSVGDGPVINADLSFIDAEGTVIGQATSDDQANYTFVVPELTPLPVRVVASGGTDLVTGRALDFNLVGVVSEDASVQASTLNLSPLSTMTVRALECSQARFNIENLNSVWSQIRSQVGMGLDNSLLPNPMLDDVDTSNVAAVVLASEALAEVVRRTSVALTNAGFAVEPADVFSNIACDLAIDRTVDGQGEGADSRVSGVFRAASAAVMLEMIAGRLEVDNQPATALMDASIAQIMPAAAGQTVLSVATSDELRDQLSKDLLLLQTRFDDAALQDLVAVVTAADPADLQRVVDAELSARSMQTLQSVVEQIALSNNGALRKFARAMAEQAERAAPYVSFFASQRRVLVGEPVIVSWASSSADRCEASGDWSGDKALEGSEEIDGLTVNSQFNLTCYGTGGTKSETVRVKVTNRGGDEQLPEPEPEPDPGTDPLPPEDPEGGGGEGTPPVSGLDVTLRAGQSSVAPGSTVQLSWESVDAQSCEASGGWSGVKSLNGQAQVGPLSTSTTFELTCSNSDGDASALVRVEVVESGTLSLRWQAPTEYDDGSALEELAGYKVLYGQSSGQYTGEASIDDGSAESVDLSLPAATYYVVMTAIDSNGFESRRSNELVLQSR